MSGQTSIEWADETWRCVPSCPQFEVTPTGLIRRVGSADLLKPMPHHKGHLYISSARGKRLYIHRAVLEAFVGPCPDGMECRHLDGNPTNNMMTNLAWGTRLENADDARLHGRKRAASYALSPLSADQVAEIKRLLPLMTRRAIAARFGVSHTTINKIAQERRWQEVQA